MKGEFYFHLDIDKMLSRQRSRMNYPEFGDTLERGMEKGLKELAKRTSENLDKNLASFGLLDSGIPPQIDIEILDDGISVIVNGEYAIFVEYGTGVVGDKSKHPKANEHGWIYDTENHGHSGWWYPSSANDPNPTLQQNKRTGAWWAWTKGQASRPFMYMTWRWLSSSGTQILRKNINKEFEILERRHKG